MSSQPHQRQSSTGGNNNSDTSMVQIPNNNNGNDNNNMTSTDDMNKQQNEQQQTSSSSSTTSTNEEASNWHVASVITQFAIASITMIAGNKAAVTQFPLPCTLVVIQAVGTVILLLAFVLLEEKEQILFVVVLEGLGALAKLLVLAKVSL